MHISSYVLSLVVRGDWLYDVCNNIALVYWGNAVCSALLCWLKWMIVIRVMEIVQTNELGSCGKEIII